jgi:hypothetical protein
MPMKRKYEAIASAALLFVFGTLGPVRADNTLEANGKHETFVPGAPYFTSTAQPAMLAINAGTITSTDNTISILPLVVLSGSKRKGPEA